MLREIAASGPNMRTSTAISEGDAHLRCFCETWEPRYDLCKRGAPPLSRCARQGGAFDFRGTTSDAADYATLAITTCVQCEQRFASRGISLRHSGHFLVVGATTGSSLCMRAISQFTGTTTKK